MKFLLLLIIVILVQTVNAQTEYRFLDRGQFKLAYRTFGEGDPIFILNGGPGRSSDTFIPLAKTISNLGYKTILFDQRGTGASKLPTVDASTIKLDLMLEDLDELRKELKYERITVLGHSFGGIYALSYASKYPSHLKSLILSASPGPDLTWQSYANSNMLSRLTSKKEKESNTSTRKTPTPPISRP